MHSTLDFYRGCKKTLVRIRGVFISTYPIIHPIILTFYTVVSFVVTPS